MSAEAAASGKLAGWRIASFESRRATDLARLFERQGAETLLAPSMREVPEVDRDSVAAFASKLLAGDCKALVLLTGVGTQLLFEELQRQHPASQVATALAHTPLLCRGPKPAAALKSAGLKPRLIAPSPNTHDELLAEIDRLQVDLLGDVYVQEYGQPLPELSRELERRRARVKTLRVYSWAYPTDTEPLELALKQLASKSVDAAVFTSAHQVRNVLQFAEQLSLTGDVQTALRDHVLVASVGPVTTRELQAHGLKVDVEPDSPKMGPLAITLGRSGPEKLMLKRTSYNQPAASRS